MSSREMEEYLLMLSKSIGAPYGLEPFYPNQMNLVMPFTIPRIDCIELEPATNQNIALYAPKGKVWEVYGQFKFVADANVADRAVTMKILSEDDQDIVSLSSQSRAATEVWKVWAGYAKPDANEDTSGDYIEEPLVLWTNKDDTKRARLQLSATNKEAGDRFSIRVWYKEYVLFER